MSSRQLSYRPDSSNRSRFIIRRFQLHGCDLRVNILRGFNFNLASIYWSIVVKSQITWKYVQGEIDELRNRITAVAYVTRFGIFRRVRLLWAGIKNMKIHYAASPEVTIFSGSSDVY